MINIPTTSKLLFLISLLILITSCKDSTLSPSNNNPILNTSAQNGKEIGIINDHKAFITNLRELNNDNEVLIVLKKASESRISRSFLEELNSGNDLIIALPKGDSSSPRSKPGFASVNSESHRAVKKILEENGVEEFRAPVDGNVITTKIPTKGSAKILKGLLNNPNVDYIEANQNRPIQYNSMPFLNSFILNIGSGEMNSQDSKHTFHNIGDAWNLTRGSGARVGILDSGISYDQSSSSYHPDGELISPTEGIQKLGFINNYCEDEGDQPYGSCLGWDDNGHGTSMSGLVGANENGMGYTGVMPDGLTVSMKVAQNCNITNCQGDSFVIEDDDFYWAIQWARNNNIDILSMSFSGIGYSSVVYNALYDIYHNDDVLLLSSTGNPSSPNEYTEPQEYDFVMGVGGLYNDGTSYGKNNFEEISALSGGGTIDALCPNDDSFCSSNGSSFIVSPSGGTSSSTAITAGIAGLVRAYNPTISASQLRQQLTNTSGDYKKIDALAAVTNNRPLSVSLEGPKYISTGGFYSWEAIPEHGDESYSYTWEFRESLNTSWTEVGSNKVYSRMVDTNGQSFFLKITVTSGNEQDDTILQVNVANSGDECSPLNPCRN